MEWEEKGGGTRLRVLLLTRNLMYYTVELANGLAACGAVPYFIYPQDGGDLVLESGETSKDFMEAVLLPEVNRDSVDIPRRTAPGTLVRNLQAVRCLWRLGRSFRPDVIHVQQNRDWRILAALCALFRSAPVVLTIHDAEAHPGERWDSRSIAVRRRIERMPRRIIVHGIGIKQRLAKRGFREEIIRVIPHGALNIYKHWQDSSVQTDPRVVLFLGRMSKYKGLEHLIKAIPLVRQIVPDARFVIAGSGPELDARLEDLRKLENTTVIPRRATNSETARLFQEAALVVLPYTEASQSGIGCLAAAFAKPVVATEVGSIPDIVRDGETGLLVPPADPEKLAAAVARMLTDSDLRAKCSENMKKLSEGPLSWDLIARQTMEVYREAIAEFEET